MTAPVRVRVECPWIEPLSVTAGLKRHPNVLAMIAGAHDPFAHGGRWSYVGCEPQAVIVLDRAEALFDILKSPPWSSGPVIGLASYDAGARVATEDREQIWPDLILGNYNALLVFDHQEKRLYAQGVGDDASAANDNALKARAWLDHAVRVAPLSAPSTEFAEEMTAHAYGVAVADVVRRIGEGEIFQANIARGWTGALDAKREPFDVFARLTQQRGAAYGAYWQLADRALVSNSPELFLSYDPAETRLETRPIKGTSARSSDPVQDRRNADELSASLKDRAENLMIVDLMRNDLARVCKTGSVRVEKLYELESHPTVHHLTSVVSGQLVEGIGVAEVLEATYPPGSITGAPKHQAMKVIAALEPSRGVWCGSLFATGVHADGDLTASVLIRTASFVKGSDEDQVIWKWRALAGAGIVADSQPDLEAKETEAKISALKAALVT